MIIEIEGVGDGTYLILVQEIVSVNKKRDYRSSTSSDMKYWNTLEIKLKTNHLSISFQGEDKKQDEAYDRIKEALKMCYAKDSVKDMIKKALEND